MADTTLVRDMISIGTPKVQYYCFPKNKNAIVAKAKLATEELYRLSRSAKQNKGGDN